MLGTPLIEISKDEAEAMVRRACAAAYHWQRGKGWPPPTRRVQVGCFHVSGWFCATANWLSTALNAPSRFENPPDREIGALSVRMCWRTA